MKFGFVRCCAATTDIRVADCEYNREKIYDAAKEAYENGAEVTVFPELCVTGYTCGDLFLQQRLINAAYESIIYLKEKSKKLDMIFAVGFPFDNDGNLYNCAAVIHKGKILGIVPKTYIPNYNEFYEKRHFVSAPEEIRKIIFDDEEVFFGTKLLFRNRNNKNFTMAVELCEDVWSVIPPSCYHAKAGADIIANLSAGNEITGKSIYRRKLIENQSARTLSGYIYTCAGEGESTTDVVFSAHNIICENGKVLKESERFKNSLIYADVDLELLNGERRRNTSFVIDKNGYMNVYFEMKENEEEIDRDIDAMPFVPADMNMRDMRCSEILDIQAYGLKKRIEHIGCKNVVVGISGGLDSTQALLVSYRAFDMLGLDKKGIITVTMPCFGTSQRTYNNAVEICRQLGTTLIEINIAEAVEKHFKDIGHDKNVHDLTFENSQARERTQILMDMAGKYNGFVVGTGDLSELALGFATYNGDHMSMYGVNASVPKTLIRYLIRYFAEKSENEKLRKLLEDVLDTPVSPELLPPDEKGNINQVTENIVGPYELHDFFLYNMMRNGFEPKKISYLAQKAFKDIYDKETIEKWLDIFYKRFFSQQFKRSCLPDGPKVGSVSLSPRGDWRMPSDAVRSEWRV
ncbi:MAG: NAD(+) synthase [Firmicutes bacterium]|nr:NAD(+) synthase [Bacillota bacterium]